MELLDHPLVVAIILFVLTWLTGWVGMIRSAIKAAELRLAAQEQFKENHLDQNSAGNRPILSTVEYRLEQLEKASDKRETESAERFAMVMRKFDDLGKSIDLKLNALETKLDRRIEQLCRERQ